MTVAAWPLPLRTHPSQSLWTHCCCHQWPILRYVPSHYCGKMSSGSQLLGVVYVDPRSYRASPPLSVNSNGKHSSLSAPELARCMAIWGNDHGPKGFRVHHFWTHHWQRTHDSGGICHRHGEITNGKPLLCHGKRCHRHLTAALPGNLQLPAVCLCAFSITI